MRCDLHCPKAVTRGGTAVLAVVAAVLAQRLVSGVAEAFGATMLGLCAAGTVIAARFTWRRRAFGIIIRGVQAPRAFQAEVRRAGLAGPRRELPVARPVVHAVITDARERASR